jgi:tctex1 domain-containing protein 2
MPVAARSKPVLQSYATARSISHHHHVSLDFVVRSYRSQQLALGWHQNSVRSPGDPAQVQGMDIAFGGQLRQVVYENTYITSPEGYGPGTKFERHRVQEVLKEMLGTHLKGQQYDPVKSSQISKMLADDLREKVGCQRYACMRVVPSAHADAQHIAVIACPEWSGAVVTA